MSSSMGKFSERLAPNHIIMEMDQFLQNLQDFLPVDELSTNPYFKKFITDRGLLKFEEFSDYLAQTLPSPRIDWYSSSDFD
jgi:hypothetical protein